MIVTVSGFSQTILDGFQLQPLGGALLSSDTNGISVN